MKSMFRRSILGAALPLAAFLAVAPGSASAQSGSGDDEAAVPEQGLEEPGLQEKVKKTEKAPPADPDSVAGAKLEARRREIQDLLNKFQEAVGHKADGLTTADAKEWDKITNAADKLVQGFIADNEKFLEAQRGLLDIFQAATDNNKTADAEKTGKEIAKLRAGFLGKLDKLAKEADRVKGSWDKLEARIQKNAEK